LVALVIRYLRQSDSYDVSGQWFLTGGQAFPGGRQ